MKRKRLVIISDLHSGHATGLTHPDFNTLYPPENPRYQLSVARREMWDFVAGAARELRRHIDALIVNGDAVHGKDPKSGGTELLTADRYEQAEMAAAAIAEFKAPRVFLAYGTPYHVGSDEDWEDIVASKAGAEKIGGHDYLDINGLVFDYRHFVSASSVPHGRHTAIARERLWSLLWAEHGEYPKGAVIVRSHVHHFNHCGGDGWLALTTPALQGPGTKHGVRQCSGTVDFGLVWFDIVDSKDWEWHWKTLRFRRAGQAAVRI